METVYFHYLLWIFYNIFSCSTAAKKNIDNIFSSSTAAKPNKIDNIFSCSTAARTKNIDSFFSTAAKKQIRLTTFSLVLQLQKPNETKEPFESRDLGKK